MIKFTNHPFVHYYFSSDAGMAALVAEYEGDTNDPLVRAFYKVIETMTSNPAAAPETIKAVMALPLDDADGHMLILLLKYLGYICCQSGRLTEAQAVVHRSDALVTPRTPPPIAALVKSLQILTASHAGDWNRVEDLLKQILKVMPANLPRRKMWVIWYCDHLYVQGRSAEAARFEQELYARLSRHFSLERIAISKSQDYLERCLAKELVAELELWARGPFIAKSRDTMLKNSLLFADMLCGKWLHGAVASPDPAGQAHESAWILATRALQERKPDLALAWARVYADTDPSELKGMGFNAFTLLRAELACGHTDAAGHLMQQRIRRGTPHYLDDFFLARISALHGERQRAAGHFEQAWQTARKYDAEARLNFELGLACELAPLELARWTMGSGRETASKSGGPVRAPVRKAAVAAPVERLIGNSRGLAEVRRIIAQFGPLDTPVLITGETGTGKELVARALHESGPRGRRPFIAVNCGAIAETLLESELFGHARGAFTGAERERVGIFEEARDGTLFLDEIGEISPRLQVSLLRVLENSEIRPVGSNRIRKIGCRVVFATNVDLDEAVQRGTFRNDLLHRLKRLELHIPPLRKRREDILALAGHFLNVGRAGTAAFLDAPLQALFAAYAWPGNVRELRNDIERLRLLNSNKIEYSAADLDATAQKKFAAGATARTARGTTHEFQTVSENSTAVDSAGQILQESKLRFRRQQRLRELFTEHQRLTRREVARILKISPITAASDLQALMAENLITRVEPSRSTATHYFKLTASSGMKAEP